MKDTSPRLGRGLAALLGENTAGAAASPGVGTVPTAMLAPSPFQPRGGIEDGDLGELVSSIQSQGILQPILVRPDATRPGHFQIVAGERRWRAAKLAGLTAVPCFIRDMSDTNAGAAALVENLQRKDLNPIEEAEGFRRLIDDFHLTQEELGAAIGKSRSHVANLLRLLGLPPKVLDYVRAGKLTAGHARAALACLDPVAAADLMVSGGLNVRQAEALAIPKSQPDRQAAERIEPSESGTADLRAVEADLAEQLGLSVAISFNGRGGAITLRYRTLDQLDYVIARLSRS